MPCLLGCLALLMPRLVLGCLFVFTHYLDGVWQTRYWPVLGFLFMPLTTLAYAFARNTSPGGSVTGWYLALVIAAAVLDVGMTGSASGRRRVGRWRQRLTGPWV